jgi:hypothetical protein
LEGTADKIKIPTRKIAEAITLISSSSYNAKRCIIAYPATKLPGRAESTLKTQQKAYGCRIINKRSGIIKGEKRCVLDLKQVFYALFDGFRSKLPLNRHQTGSNLVYPATLFLLAVQRRLKEKAPAKLCRQGGHSAVEQNPPTLKILDQMSGIFYCHGAGLQILQNYYIRG